MRGEGDENIRICRYNNREERVDMLKDLQQEECVKP